MSYESHIPLIMVRLIKIVIPIYTINPLNTLDVLSVVCIGGWGGGTLSYFKITIIVYQKFRTSIFVAQIMESSEPI